MAYVVMALSGYGLCSHSPMQLWPCAVMAYPQLPSDRPQVLGALLLLLLFIMAVYSYGLDSYGPQIGRRSSALAGGI